MIRYTIILTETAEKQLREWSKSGQKKTLKKILSLFEELQEHPKQVQDKWSSYEVT